MKHSITRRVRGLVFFALRISIALFIAIGIASAVVYSGLVPCIPTRRITVHDTKLWACIANNEILQVRGLSNTRHLPRNWAMLFVFDDYSNHRFWMKDMNYPIDMLWLDDDLNVVEVARNASPDTYPDLYAPIYANRYVLETNPGAIEGEFPLVNIVNR